MRVLKEVILSQPKSLLMQDWKASPPHGCYPQIETTAQSQIHGHQALSCLEGTPGWPHLSQVISDYKYNNK